MSIVRNFGGQRNIHKWARTHGKRFDAWKTFRPIRMCFDGWNAFLWFGSGRNAVALAVVGSKEHCSNNG